MKETHMPQSAESVCFLLHQYHAQGQYVNHVVAAYQQNHHHMTS